MLRKVILAYGVLVLVGGIALAVAGVLTALVFYLCVNGAVVIAALLFERGRYRPTITPGGTWQETGERFVDPSTGQLMKVRYNPQTGARDYVPVQPPPGPSPQGGGR
jgi:hypothetical protein